MRRWLTGLLMCFLAATGAAQDVFLVPGGEVNGVRVESFYLSVEVITNQDFFSFIQRDGYKKKYLWDSEALQSFDKFKNAQGELAPRSWKGSSPPGGEEFQPVSGISLAEARAYAAQTGWIIPNTSMWKLAEQVKPEIGSYPWKDDGDNATPILLARHFVPARMWEDGMKKLRDEISLIKKSAASISSVNTQAAGIQKLEKNSELMARDLANMQSQVQAMENRLPTPEQLRKIEQTAAQVSTLETKVADLLLAAARVQTLEDTIKNRGEAITNLEKKLESLDNQVTTLKDFVNALTKVQDKSMQSLRDEINEKQTSTDQSVTKLREQNFDLISRINSSAAAVDEMRTSINTLKQGDTNLNNDLQSLKKQNDVMAKTETSLQDQITNANKRHDKEEKDIAELFKQAAKIQGNNEDLGNKIREGKDVDSAQARRSDALENDLKNTKDGVDRQVAQSKKLENETVSIRDDILRKKKEALEFETETRAKIEKLDKRSDETGKAISGLEEKWNGKLVDSERKSDETNKQRDKELRQDMAKLTERTTHNEGELAKLDKQISSQDVNVASSVETLKNRVKDLEEKTSQVESDLRIGASQLRSNMVEIGEKMRQLFQQGMTIGAVPGKDEPIVVKPKDDSKKPEKSGEIDKKTIAQLCYVLGERCAQYKQPQVALAFSDVALQFVPNFADAQQAAQQYQEDVKNSQAQLAKEQAQTVKELKAVRDAIKEVKESRTVVQDGQVVREIAKGVDTAVVADLCYVLGKEYYAQNHAHLALACLELGIKLHGEHAEIRRFLRDHWAQLNCPEGMVYIPAGKAHLGSRNDREFPEKEKELTAFYLDQWEVSRKQFAQFVAQGGYEEKSWETLWSKEGLKWLTELRKNNHQTAWELFWERNGKSLSLEEESLSVTEINYYEAQAYCKWADRRLPSIEEWEYAARGTDMRKFPWGNEAPFNDYKKYFRANYKQLEDPFDSTLQVAPGDAFPHDLSPFGVRHMAGNVSEWCLQEKMFAQTKDGKQEFCPIKGGSFNTLWFRMQTFYKALRKPGEWHKDKDIGFRCLKEIPENPYK